MYELNQKYFFSGTSTDLLRSMSLRLCSFQIRQSIVDRLEQLRDNPKRLEKPFIYHLDVGAMYPNIILTNRLQPNAIVTDATCAACDYNQSKNGCKRRMDWVWRGDYNPATKSEYERTKDQLNRELHRDGLPFEQLPEREQVSFVSNRLKDYARKAYKKTKVTEEETRTDVVCMRENDFYVDTVRQFRDRRYEYKKMNKDWKKKATDAKDSATKKLCEDRVLVYDSLQVAHKCILNSFYGYVMRKGARWRSMEMAGIVTKTGADIITQARMLVEQIGRPLELDTDGIWCILPGSFPDVYSFSLHDGTKLKVEYPCLMLNANVHDQFSNHQYQTLIDPDRGIYETRSECSIFFEVDGPYRCMVIPASIEEGKLLKKRYAVFNFDGSLAELKGFELKRRGELELIKTFQSQVFERFLDGTTLKECYDCVANVANHWIDVIDTRGDSLDTDELVDLISENRNMSRQLDDYGEQKGTSQTTARRLGEFLGAEIIKDKGLNCKFIIAEQPYGAPVTERAIPTAIWKAEPTVMKHFLRKWLKSPGLDGDGLDIRNILDWDYYLDRLGKTIQKIISIPAALQKVPNPVPRVPHPDWLESKVKRLNERYQQQNIRSMFGVKSTGENAPRPMEDIEDMNGDVTALKRPLVHKMSIREESTDPDSDKFTIQVPQSRIDLTKESFGDWLRQKKSIWRKAIKERQDISSLSGRVGDVKKQRKNVSVDGFIRAAADSLNEKEWQILEVREMSSYDAQTPSSHSGSGDFILWAMIGQSSLQRIVITVPRIVYISSLKEITNSSNEIIDFRQVDKHLPYSKNSPFLYEVTLLEHVYKSRKWIKLLQPVDPSHRIEDVLGTMYESGTPLLTRALTELGSIVKVSQSASRSKIKSYFLSELARVDRPTGGEYLHRQLSYKRVFMYIRVNPKTKTGIVTLFSIGTSIGSDESRSDSSSDVTRPSEYTSSASFDVGATCSIWIIKPKTRNSQKSVSVKQCEALFGQLIETIQDAAGTDSDYSCVSPSSFIQVSSLKIVESEALAYAGANEAINTQSKSGGATFILLNSSRPTPYIRRYMSVFSSFPVCSMAFPPGPAHDPLKPSLPSLNWEAPAVQLSLEAYLFMIVISFPKRVSYCRYGQVPLGNLGEDENNMIFDVSMCRMIQKNRALSWASCAPGRPDVGIDFMPSTGGGSFPGTEANATYYNQDEIWGDDDELISPIIRRPGCYRSICVDIDVQDLAIASLTNAALSVPLMGSTGLDASSPSSVAMFGSSLPLSKVAGPLGDDMSTSISLPIVRSLVSGWLKDAFTTSSLVADELLHHIYRLISNPETLLHDHALHRVVHSLMKSTFLRLLSELQGLGCTVVYASFHKITVATNKLELSDAEEYINFVIETSRRQTISNGDHDDSLAKVSLRPRQFHTHFVFLDEYNFGTMQLDRVLRMDLEDSIDFAIPDGNADSNSVVVPSVVTAWSIMNYLGNEVAQEYFRAIIGRFSKDVFRKQMELALQDGVLPIAGALGLSEQVLTFKRKMISKHFATYLTRAVSEIIKEGPDENMMPPILIDQPHHFTPALEYIKNVITVLELDTDVDNEVHGLKRSLLSQIGVAEYSMLATWINPCPTYILPDVFCTECHESRDVNLCYVPPRQMNEDIEKQWTCDDCGTPYNVSVIEGRLLHLLHKKLVRYVLQDVRCVKTNRVATRALVPLSDCAANLKLDISQETALKELRLLRSLATFHDMELLQETVESILSSYR
jgi:DNA polymerase epsilon subunit 1